MSGDIVWFSQLGQVGGACATGMQWVEPRDALNTLQSHAVWDSPHHKESGSSEVLVMLLAILFRILHLFKATRKEKYT